jgi:hypothetical protein
MFNLHRTSPKKPQSNPVSIYQQRIDSNGVIGCSCGYCGTWIDCLSNARPIKVGYFPVKIEPGAKTVFDLITKQWTEIYLPTKYMPVIKSVMGCSLCVEALKAIEGALTDEEREKGRTAWLDLRDDSLVSEDVKDFFFSRRVDPIEDKRPINKPSQEQVSENVRVRREYLAREASELAEKLASYHVDLSIEAKERRRLVVKRMGF